MAETETRERTESPRVETPTRAPLVSQRDGGANVTHKSAPVGSRPLTFREMLALANELFSSGILPKSIKNKGQAFAIILAGQEMGVPPMRALRSINFMSGKLIVGADLQLGLFKRAGGHARWLQYSDDVCELELIAPNGDKAVEKFSTEDVKRAKLDADAYDFNGKLVESNHKKYPRFMKRSRCITGALKTIGFEDTAGAYDPDEAASFDSTGGEAPVAVVEAPTAVEPSDSPATSQEPPTAGNAPVEPETSQAEPETASAGTPPVVTPPSVTFDPTLFPFEPRKGVKLDTVEMDGDTVKLDANGLPVYAISETLLTRAAQWAIKQRKEKPNDSRFPAMLDAIEKESERRIDEHDAHFAKKVETETERPAETETASAEAETDTTRAE